MTLKERIAQIKEDPATPEIVYANIANGGSLLDLCDTWDVPYHEIARWFDSDPGRKQLYADAIKARCEWTDEMVLAELRLMGRFDIRKLYNLDGSLKNMADLDAQTARMVQSVEVDELFEGAGKEKEQVGFSKKVKLWDKLKSLDMIARNRGLVAEKHIHEGKMTLEELIAGSYQEPNSKKTNEVPAGSLGLAGVPADGPREPVNEPTPAAQVAPPEITPSAAAAPGSAPASEPS